MSSRVVKSNYTSKNRIPISQTEFPTRNKRHKDHEVEAYTNPTELFRWINFCRWDKAAKRVRNAPSEASVWIVSREADQTLKWKYLPLHLVCLQPNPPRTIIKALLDAYPKAVSHRDNDGNLPIHYACTEGVDDKEVLKMLIEIDPNTLLQADSYGRTALQILHNPIDTKKISPRVREMMSDVILWQQKELRSMKDDYDEVREPAEDYRKYGSKRSNQSNRRPSKTRHVIKEISIENTVSNKSKFDVKIAEQQKKIEALERREYEQNEVIKDLELELKKKGISMEESESRVKTLENKLKIATSENETVEEKLKKVKLDNAEAEKTNQLIMAERKRNDQEKTLIEEELAKLKASCAVKDAKYEELKDAEKRDREKISNLESKELKSSIEMRSLQQKYDDLQLNQTTLKKNLEKEVADNDINRKKLERKIQTLNDDVKSKENQIKLQQESISEIDKLRKRVVELTENNHQYQKEIEDQKIEFDTTMLRIQTVLSKQANAFSTLQDGPEDDTSLIELEDIMTISTSGLMQNNDNALAAAQSQIRQLTLEKHDLRAESLSLSNKVTLLQNEIRVLTVKLECTEDELKGKNDIIEDLKDEKEVMFQSRAKDINDCEDELRKEIMQLNEKVVTLSEIKYDTSSESEKDDGKIIELENENMLLREKLKNVTTTMSDQIESYEQEIKELSKKNENLRSRTEDARDDSLINICLSGSSKFDVEKSIDDKVCEACKSQENSIQILKKHIEELKEINQTQERKLTFLSSNKGVRQQLHGFQLSEKVSELASSLTDISYTQCRLVETVTAREKQFQENANTDRERLMQTIARQEKEMELAARKREQVMKALAKQEEELQVAAVAEREKIIALAKENEVDLHLASVAERDSISNAVAELQKEIQSLQIEIGFTYNEEKFD